jgi:hypothetical protein
MLVRPIPTVPTGDRYDAESKYTHKGMAHFAGTGPIGVYCGTCTHYRKRPHAAKFVCWKFRYMSKGWGDPIPATALACRHYQERRGQP